MAVTPAADEAAAAGAALAAASGASRRNPASAFFGPADFRVPEVDEDEPTFRDGSVGAPC